MSENQRFHNLYGLVKIIKKNIDIVCVPVIIEENMRFTWRCNTCQEEQSV